MTTQQSATKPRPTDWPRDETFDVRDKYYVPSTYFNLKAMSPLNLREDNEYKRHFLPVYDQSPAKTSLDEECWGTCVANAAAAAFAYEWNRQGLQPSLHPSRLFLYFNARKLEFEISKEPSSKPKSKHPKDQGVYIRLACKALEKMGVCPEGPGQQEWGYDDVHFAVEPTVEVLKAALENRSVQYARLDPDHPEGFPEKELTTEEKGIIGAMTLLRLRQCLGEGYPVIFGFSYYWKNPPFRRDEKSGGIWDIGPLPGGKGPEKNHGGRAVLAVGFDDGNQRVLCQNSWGGRQGCGWEGGGGVRRSSGWATNGSRTFKRRATFG